MHAFWRFRREPSLQQELRRQLAAARDDAAALERSVGTPAARHA
jgi:hypothetical protein